MKKIDNTILICISFGLLFGSLIATIVIDRDYFVLTMIFAIVFSFFYATHGNNKNLFNYPIPPLKNSVMKTIQFTGTEHEIENLHLALGISDNDMPQQSETRVYVLDAQDIPIDKDFEELTDEEWIAECERQGKVYSLQGFARAFNEAEISTDTDVVKIINVIKFNG